VQSPFQGINYSLAFACFESLLLVTGHLLMDNHPPARRPHKSPAHTVKDPRGRPQRLSRCSPRITKVPEGADYLTANFDSVNTVSAIFFGSPPARSGLTGHPVQRAAHLTASFESVNRSKPLSCRASRLDQPDDQLHLGGARIVHMHNEIWKRFFYFSGKFFC
jgi:hypothetical protein